MKLRKTNKKPYDQDNGKTKTTYPISHVRRLVSPQGNTWDVWQISKEEA
jgi:hypothetical protein